MISTYSTQSDVGMLGVLTVVSFGSLLHDFTIVFNKQHFNVWITTKHCIEQIRSLLHKTLNFNKILSCRNQSDFKCLCSASKILFLYPRGMARGWHAWMCQQSGLITIRFPDLLIFYYLDQGTWPREEDLFPNSTIQIMIIYCLRY